MSERIVISRLRGFTLIEVLIVIVVLSIMATIAINTYQSYTIRSNRAVMQTQMTQIAQSLAGYKSLNNNYNTSLVAIYGATTYPTQRPMYNLALDTTTIAGGWTLTATPSLGSRQVGNGILVLNDQGWTCWNNPITNTQNSCNSSNLPTASTTWSGN